MLMRPLTLTAILLLSACASGSSVGDDTTPNGNDTPVTDGNTGNSGGDGNTGGNGGDGGTGGGSDGDGSTDGDGSSGGDGGTGSGSDGDGFPATDVVPISSEGFATADKTIGFTGQTFTITDMKFNATPKDGTGTRQPVSATGEMSASYNADGTVTLTYDGESITLTETEDGDFAGANGDLIGFYQRVYNRSEGVETTFFNFNDDETKRDGFLVVGFDTHPSEVAELTGTAAYNGQLNLRIATGPNLYEEDGIYNGAGPGSLIANFENGTIVGDFNVSDPLVTGDATPGAEDFPNATVRLRKTDILENGFDGDLEVTFADGGFGNTTLTLEDGTYNGRFYGEDGISVGGQVSGTVTGGDDTYVLQGGFSANRSRD